MLDLDDWERAAKAAMQRDERTNRIVTMLAGEALAAVAELRAAREVIEATREFLAPPQTWDGKSTVSALEVREHIAAYDKVTGEATHA
jgi:hypothetical protein